MDEVARRRARAAARSTVFGRKGGLELEREACANATTPAERVGQVRGATRIG